MNKEHKHYQLAKKWLEGTKIQKFHLMSEDFVDDPCPTWLECNEYREKPVKKWTPKYRLVVAEIDDNSSNSSYKDVADDVKNYWKLTKFVEEFEQDWDKQDYEVFADVDGNYDIVASYDNYTLLGVVRMSEQCAEKLCEMLNNGEIEL